MERLRRHPIYTSWVVGIVAGVVGVFASTPGDLFSAFVFGALAVALALAALVVLRRQGPHPS